MRRLLICVVALALSLGNVVAQGDAGKIAFSNLTVSSSSDFNGRDDDDAFNGLGLSGDTHDADANNMWLTDTGDGVADSWLKVGLGGNYPLDYLRVWNYNESAGGGLEERGINQCDIFVADTDPGVNVNGSKAAFNSNGWTLVTEDQIFAMATGVAGITNTDAHIGLGGVSAAYLAIRIDSNHPGGDVYVGLSEMQIYWSTFLGSIGWSNLVTSSITADSAWAGAHVSTNLDQTVLVWDTSDQGTFDVADWSASRSLGASPAGSVSAQATNLQADTSYTWRFYGTNATAGTHGWSAVASFASGLSSAQVPQFTNALPVEDTIKLAWLDNASFETGYLLQRSTNGVDFVLHESLPADTVSYWDGGLPGGVTYTYRLAATNANTGTATAFVDCQTNATAIGADAIGLNAGTAGIVSPPVGATNPETGISWAFGDTYQLIFITSTETNVASDEGILFWDVHVNSVADGSSLPGVPSVNWSVMASTVDVDARDHAVVSAPVLLMNGTNLVASGFEDMWDGSLTTDVTLDESGNIYVGENECWTGSDQFGVKVSNLEIGNTLQSNVRTGHFPPGSGNWFTNRDRAESDTKRFYALSQVLTILETNAVDATPPTPDPMTFYTVPAAETTNTIRMTATAATDAATPPVMYLFTNSVTGVESGWQTSPTWVSTVIPNTVNVFRVKARDAVSNETAWSSPQAATGLLKGPGGVVAPTGIHPSKDVPWQVGDTYHLMFISSVETNTASDGDITVWDAFVNAVASASSLPAIPGVTWSALCSTPDVDARDHGLVVAPVYMLDGVTKVVDDFADMWDGGLDNDVILDESGKHYSLSGGETEVWTGSGSNGIKANNREVGNPLQSSVRTAHFPPAGPNWFTNSDRAETDTKRFYALSKELTILRGDEPDTTPPKPDPMTFFTVPTASATNSITMTASSSADALSPPIEYLFTNAVTGDVSGWQLVPTWVDMVNPSTLNSYRVKARDALGNETAWSAPSSATGVLNGPNGIVAPTGMHPTNGAPWQVGDTYHLVFVTSGTTNLVGDFGITVWNDYVDAIADGSSLPGVSDVSWKVLGSTLAVDAKDNALITAPVYLMDGLSKVADDFDDMWDGSINTRITMDESGILGYSGNLWTGSKSDGTQATAGGPLDVFNNSTGAGAITGSGNWFANRWYAETDNRRFYALSQKLRIVDGDEADTTPPSPTNMTFFTVPLALSSNSITMTATTADDPTSPPVEYVFTNAVTGEISGWQIGTTWIHSVDPNSLNTYRVKARDAVGNETAWSEPHSATPLLRGPNGIVAPTGMHPSNGVPWQVGDTYQLVFLTSIQTNLVGDHAMHVWNNDVNDVAGGSSLPGMADPTWYTLASTREINANANAVVQAPVYLVDGVSMVASNYNDMWDGGLASRISVDESGVGHYTGNLWTGSLADGTKRANAEINNVGTIVGAGAITGNGNWFANREYAETESRRFYVMSQVLTIRSGDEIDITPPSATNTTFEVAPTGRGETLIDMWATPAYDVLSPPVTYLFTNTAAGSSSGWLLRPYWADTVAEESLNTYRVKARDAVGNETAWSDPASARPLLLGVGGLVTPRGINPLTGLEWSRGDYYQLAFVTRSGVNRGDASEGIAFWNSHINDVADGSTAPGVSNVSWTVIASSDDVDARSNAVVNWPVYLLDGSTMLASNATDMWDDSLHAAISVNENAQFDGSGADVWTGSDSSGQKQTGYALDSSGNAQVGRMNIAGAGWIDRSASVASGSALRFYALSQPLIIPTNGTVDLVGPSPDPMRFADEPIGLTATTIVMRATPAYDVDSPPVEYRFENVGNGATSDWQRSITWVDTVDLFAVNTYRVKARDAAGHETAWSDEASSAPVLFGPYGIPAPSGTHPVRGDAWRQGDLYQLAFVSSQEYVGTGSGDISFWNNRVRVLAGNSSVSNLARVSWSVIGSTADVDARDHAHVAAPVVTMDGTAIAVNRDDVWDGDLISPIRVDEHGVRHFIGGPATDFRVWTGTDTNGIAVLGEALGTNTLTAGSFQSAGAAWINAFSGQTAGETAFLYALSEVLTIQGTPSGYILIVR